MQNEKSPEIQVLVGLPGSGKSTYLAKMWNDAPPDFPPCRVISTDNIIELLAIQMGRQYNDVWKDIIDPVTKIVKYQFGYALADKVNIYYDQTNLTADKRRSILSHVSSDYRKIAVVFTPPFDIIKERLALRRQKTGKTISLNIVEDMQKRFEYPSLEEGFHEIRVEDHVSEQNNARDTRDNP